jgi:hypothetical protein
MKAEIVYINPKMGFSLVAYHTDLRSDTFLRFVDHIEGGMSIGIQDFEETRDRNPCAEIDTQSGGGGGKNSCPGNRIVEDHVNRIVDDIFGTGGGV